MANKNYLDYILNPLELLRTQKVLHVNPTVTPERKLTADTVIKIFEYNLEKADSYSLAKAVDCFPFLTTASNTWINVDGLRKDDVENICNHFGIHQLITEDILSLGQRPKMDELNGLVFCLLNMLYFNEKDSAVETEQVSIILGKNFVISFQEDAGRDVFDPVRDKIKIAGSKLRLNSADFLFYSLIDIIVDNYYLVKWRELIKMFFFELIFNKNICLNNKLI